MKMCILSPLVLKAFRHHLICEERSAHTVEKYMRDATAFYTFVGPDRAVEKELVIAYKRRLTERYQASSVNSMLVAVNGLLDFMGLAECRVRLLRVQREVYRKPERELSKPEYDRLLAAARAKKNERLYLLMQTLCSTGLRVSEHQFVTVEALRRGEARVRNKGKERVVFLPKELTRLLLGYCRRAGVSRGAVFVTRGGRPLDRSNIWAAMKKLCQDAHVEPKKVYPHNLRHLFALTYYRLQKDVMRLADILGHSSVETTRVYTATSGAEQKRLLSRLGLVCCSV